MVHSGSRGIGPAIRDHHLRHAEDVGGGLRALDVRQRQWRRVSARCLLGTALRRRKPEGDGRGSRHRDRDDDGCAPLLGDGHHDRPQPRVARSSWRARALGPPEGRDAGRAWESWVFCRGRWAAPAFTWRDAVTKQALCSSAHGAGRALSRTAARAKVTERELRRQMEGVWYDYRLVGEASRRSSRRLQGHQGRASRAGGSGEGDAGAASGAELQGGLGGSIRTRAANVDPIRALRHD